MLNIDSSRPLLKSLGRIRSLKHFMIRGHIILFFPLVDWDTPWQRYQHLALRFSNANRVIYVNSPAAITYLRRSPAHLAKKWLRFIRGKEKINSNLSIYHPPPCLPCERISKWVNRLNQYILFLYLKIFVKSEDNIILWINDPYKYLMTKLLKPRIAVYDCPDAIVFQNGRLRQKVYDELKRKVLKESTISFFTSKALLAQGRKYSETCFYVPNGVDARSFRRASYRVPDDMRKLQGIILGAVGTFDERIDLELIEFVLETIKYATLLLVGPVQMKLGNLARHPRVVLSGKREYEEIPSFINKFDVALIPYRINKVTMAVYPVKLHEYLILGKPVVSTDLPEVRQFSNVIWVGHSKEEFARQVQEALADNDETKREKRVEVAKNNSWERRITDISNSIERYLK